MARTEFGVAIGSVLIVAGVLAIPIVAPAPTSTPLAIPRVIVHPTPTPTGTAASALIGSGCAAYEATTPSGSGSIVGMSQDPVAVSASNNPLLTKLTSAVSGKLNPKVNLVSTLDSAQFTVFAPVDAAFAKLPAATLTSLAQPANAAQLTSILEYNVVPGELLPANLTGTLNSLEGGTLTIAGSGDDLTVNGAHLVCGGIQTSNAVVYMIDTVLTPPAK
jgi:uncharacterized surface protein with fasciclin (FAS1) repeats